MDLGSGDGLHSPDVFRLSENTVRCQNTLPDRATGAGRLSCKYESKNAVRRDEGRPFLPCVGVLSSGSARFRSSLLGFSGALP